MEKMDRLKNKLEIIEHKIGNAISRYDDDKKVFLNEAVSSLSRAKDVVSRLYTKYKCFLRKYYTVIVNKVNVLLKSVEFLASNSRLIEYEKIRYENIRNDCEMVARLIDTAEENLLDPQAEENLLDPQRNSNEVGQKSIFFDIIWIIIGATGLAIYFLFTYMYGIEGKENPFGLKDDAFLPIITFFGSVGAGVIAKNTMDIFKILFSRKKTSYNESDVKQLSSSTRSIFAYIMSTIIFMLIFSLVIFVGVYLLYLVSGQRDMIFANFITLLYFIVLVPVYSFFTSILFHATNNKVDKSISKVWLFFAPGSYWIEQNYRENARTSIGDSLRD